MSTRPAHDTAPAGKLARVGWSAFRLTPLGDALRGWLSVLFAFAVGVGTLRVRGTAGENYLIIMLVALDAFFFLYLVSTWVAMHRASAADAREWAHAQDGGSRRTRLLKAVLGTRLFSGGAGLFTIIAVSLGGLMFALSSLPDGNTLGTVLLRTALCVLGVVTAWMLLHTSFALYYTHLYYHGEEPGGLEFPGAEEPDPLDFAYFAFTVGISFAASDVAISSRNMRRTTLFHGIVAFFYNTAILALVINIVLSRAA